MPFRDLRRKKPPNNSMLTVHLCSRKPETSVSIHDDYLPGIQPLVNKTTQCRSWTNGQGCARKGIRRIKQFNQTLRESYSSELTDPLWQPQNRDFQGLSHLSRSDLRKDMLTMWNIDSVWNTTDINLKLITRGRCKSCYVQYSLHRIYGNANITRCSHADIPAPG